MRPKDPKNTTEASSLLNRRAFLSGAAAAAAGLVGQRAFAIGRPTRLRLATLALPGAGSFPREGVPEVWAFELGRFTSVEVSGEVPHLGPSDPKLFEHPLIILAGATGFAPLSAEHRAQLGLFLRSGGMLFIDDISGLHESDFAASVQRELKAIFPTEPLARLDRGHALHRSFFLIQRVVGRLALRPYVEGITLGDISPVVFSRNDLLGALARDNAGVPLYACVPGGEDQRMWAFKLSINMVMYALTLNYKLDATHVRALLEKRRGVYDQ